MEENYRKVSVFTRNHPEVTGQSSLTTVRHHLYGLVSLRSSPPTIDLHYQMPGQGK